MIRLEIGLEIRHLGVMSLCALKICRCCCCTISQYYKKSRSFQGPEFTIVALWPAVIAPKLKVLGKGQITIFSLGEYGDHEKIVCMRKVAEINCLPQRCI